MTWIALARRAVSDGLFLRRGAFSASTSACPAQTHHLGRPTRQTLLLDRARLSSTTLWMPHRVQEWKAHFSLRDPGNPLCPVHSEA